METKVLLNMVMILKIVKLLDIKNLIKWIIIVKFVVNVSKLRVNLDILYPVFIKNLINVNI